MITVKTLVVYFSHSNNTKRLAESIAAKLKTVAFRIETTTPYPAEHQSVINQVSAQNKAGILPEISHLSQNINDFNTLMLGFPIWKNRLPPPIHTFLRNNKLTGKVVIPFCTHSGLGLGISIREIIESCPGVEIREAFYEKGENVLNADALIDAWLNKVILDKTIVQTTYITA